MPYNGCLYYFVYVLHPRDGIPASQGVISELVSYLHLQQVVQSLLDWKLLGSMVCSMTRQSHGYMQVLILLCCKVGSSIWCSVMWAAILVDQTLWDNSASWGITGRKAKSIFEHVLISAKTTFRVEAV